jgi:SAM-dependent methyltransferase
MISIDKCPVCGNSSSLLIFEGKDRLHNKQGVFSVNACKSCGLYYLNPHPDSIEINEYYPESYICYQTAVEDEPSRIRRLDRKYGLYKRYRQIIRRVPKPGYILDIGCATGLFLNSMKLKGWKVYGIEPSPLAAQYAQQRFGLDVVQDSFESAGLDNNIFDVVTLWDVFEHVSNPLQTIQKIWDVLKPGGLLVINLPNPESWDRYMFGKYWAGWDVPRHYQLFTRKLLVEYLERAGFKVLEVQSFTGSHGVLVLNIQFWLADWKGPEIIKKNLIPIVRSIPARVVTYPFFWLISRLNKSATMTLFAQKKENKTENVIATE